MEATETMQSRTAIAVGLAFSIKDERAARSHGGDTCLISICYPSSHEI